MIGSVLLIIPGLLTSAIGLLLLLPPTRYVIARALRAVITRKIQDGTVHVRVGVDHAPPPGIDPDKIIDVDPDPDSTDDDDPATRR
jgi:UPF0716 protein FxsA